MNQKEIRKQIYLTGYSGNYKVRTGGIGGLPYEIDLTDYRLGNALVRTLRAEAKTRDRRIEPLRPQPKELTQ
jgi:hypothetical protein